MTDQTAKKEKVENAIEIVSFDLKNRVVNVSEFRDPGVLVPHTISFDSLEAKPGKKVTLTFPFKDGTKLIYDLPPKLEAGSTVVFKIDPVGKGLAKTNFTGMSAEKHIIDTNCAGWFRLKDRKEPTVSLKFTEDYPNPFLPYEIEETDISSPLH